MFRRGRPRERHRWFPCAPSSPPAATIIRRGGNEIPAVRLPIVFNGREILLENPPFYAGAALLFASGKSENLPKLGEPPYLFCGNGACRDCNLHVDGVDDVSSCQLPLAPGMSFRPGEGAGEENALTRNLQRLYRGEGEPLDVALLIVGAGIAGSAAFEAARALGVDAIVADTRSGRPVSVRGGRLEVAEDGFVRAVNARAVVLATGANTRNEPQLAIAKALGCRTVYDRALRQERLALDSNGETSVPGIFAAGDVASASDAIESARRAGEAAAARIGKSP